MKFLIFISLVCAGCCSCNSSKNVEQRRIEQPEALFLGPRTAVPQSDGTVYVSGSTVEIWHSEKTVEKLEKDLSRFNPQP